MTDLVSLTCEDCGRSGEVKPRFLDLGSHRVAIEPTDGDIVFQWQEWSGHWFCHTCLAEFASENPERFAPEAVSGDGSQ